MSDTETEEKPKKKPKITPITIDLPPNVSVEKEIKSLIIDATKAAIKVLQDNEVYDPDLSFDDVLNEPANLKSFFQAFRDNLDLFSETVVDKSGDPVTDELTETICGVTLQQVQKLLVSTCARRFFIRNDGQIIEKKQKKKVKSMLIFTKEITVKKKVKLKEGAKKFDAMKRVIGFEWQLDLLEYYRDRLPFSHLLVLGDDVLAIQDEVNADEVAAVHQEDFKKVKEIVGPHFRNVLAHGASAIPGILYWRKDLIPTFIGAMGEKAWDFFRRDKEFFDHCTELDNPRISIYGDVLTYIHAKNLTEMDRLNLDRLDATLRAMEDTFGEKVSEILGHEEMSTEVLRSMVDSFIHLEAKDNEQFNTAARTAVHSLKDEVLTLNEELNKNISAED